MSRPFRNCWIKTRRQKLSISSPALSKKIKDQRLANSKCPKDLLRETSRRPGLARDLAAQEEEMSSGKRQGTWPSRIITLTIGILKSCSLLLRSMQKPSRKAGGGLKRLRCRVSLIGGIRIPIC